MRAKEALTVGQHVHKARGTAGLQTEWLTVTAFKIKDTKKRGLGPKNSNRQQSQQDYSRELDTGQVQKLPPRAPTLVT